MLSKTLKYFYISSTDLISNKIKLLTNNLFKGINIKLKKVNLIGNITLKQLNVTKVNIQYQNNKGKLQANITLLAQINQNIDFECYCNIQTIFYQQQSELIIQQLRSKIKSKNDPITSMVIQNIINEYIVKYKIQIPKKIQMLKQLITLQQDEQNDVIVFDYQNFKEKQKDQTLNNQDIKKE